MCKAICPRCQQIVKIAETWADVEDPGFPQPCERSDACKMPVMDGALPTVTRRSARAWELEVLSETA